MPSPLDPRRYNRLWTFCKKTESSHGPTFWDPLLPLLPVPEHFGSLNSPQIHLLTFLCAVFYLSCSLPPLPALCTETNTSKQQSRNTSVSFKDRFLTEVCQTCQKETLEVSKGKYLGFSCDHILSQQQMEVALVFVASIGKLNPPMVTRR